MTDTEKRAAALAAHLGCDLGEVESLDYSAPVFEVQGEEWLVLTDSEADTQAREQILDSLWAFNTSFLQSHSEALRDEGAAKAFDAMREKICEGANALVRRLIDDLDHFVDDAVKSDGRGHFLSSYDGEEVECGGFYLYRVN